MKLFNLFISLSTAVDMDCHHGCEMINGSCRNTNGTSFYGDSCEYLEPILKCSKNSISLHIESLNNEKYSSIAFIAPAEPYDDKMLDLFIPQHDPAANLCRFSHINRNGKLFIEIMEENYETCGITTQLIDGDGTGSYMSYSGHVWSNIEHAVISRPKALFNFQCVHLFSGFTFQPPSIGEIDDDEKLIPKIVRHVTQKIQIELFLSAPGLNDRKRLSQYPNQMAMVGEMVWATIDLSQINFYRLHSVQNAHLVLDQCKLISTGENAQEIQLINEGCPMLDFVTIQSHKGPQIHFSTRVLRFRHDYSNDQITLGCSLTVKKTDDSPLC